MELRRRLLRALTALGILAVFAAAGYHTLGPSVSWLDAFYMVVISLTGVGYAEIVNTSGSPALRVFNILVLIGGVGIMIYVVALATAVFVEGKLGGQFRRRKMERRIIGFKGHVIVCGAGETGTLVADELRKTGRSAVIIDLRPERLESLPDHPGLATITGDATDPDTLERAGLERASTVVTALPHEKDNLVVTVLVRQRDPAIRIVARHVDPGMAARLRKAGADATVSPTAIGGMRLASEAVRPQVVSFLDSMVKDPNHTVRIEEIHVPQRSAWAGKGLGTLDLRTRFALTPLALRDTTDAPFRYGPLPEDTLREGAVLVVLGEVSRIAEARLAAQGL